MNDGAVPQVKEILACSSIASTLVLPSADLSERVLKDPFLPAGVS
ncbi:MAG TPA: hypothetical protein VGF67_27115 [Ktedonobacteraceae bacterium]